MHRVGIIALVLAAALGALPANVQASQFTAANPFPMKARLDPNPIPLGAAGVIRVATVPNAECIVGFKTATGAVKTFGGATITQFDGIAVFGYSPSAGTGGGTIIAMCSSMDTGQQAKTTIPFRVGPLNRPPDGPPHATTYITPSTVVEGSTATIWVKSSPGIICMAGIRYNSGDISRSFDGYIQHVGPNGIVIWTWHVIASGQDGGEVTASCFFKQGTAAATGYFNIVSS